MIRDDTARSIIRRPIARLSGMPRGPGGQPEVLIDSSPGTGGVPWSSDPWGWPDDFNAYRVLDWRAGDEINPLVGPTLTLTGTTTPTKTPYSGRLGAIAGEQFTSTTQYTAALVASPDATTDAIYVVAYRGNARVAGGMYQSPFAAYTTRGVFLYINSTWRLQGDTAVSLFAGFSYNAYGVYACVICRDTAKAMSYANGAYQSEQPTPAGTLASSNVYIGRTGTYNFRGEIVRIQVFLGVGIGALYTGNYAKYHAAAIEGLAPTRPRVPVAFTRTGAIFTPIGTDVFPVSDSCPRVDPAKGVSNTPAQTNDAYRSFGLVAGDEAYIDVSAGLTKTTAAVDLSAYGVYGGTGLVYEVANATGSDGYVWSGSVSVSTAVRCVSVRAHHVTGTGVLLGLGDATPVWTALGAISDNYTRTYGLVTPANNTQRWGLLIPDGVTVRFAVMGNVVSPIKTPEIPNLATAASAAVGAASINWGVALSNDKVQIEATVEPDDWAGAEDATTRRVLSDATSAGRHCEIRGATQEAAIHDGTNEAKIAFVEAVGVAKSVITSYGSKGLLVEVGGAQDTDPYDGAIGAGNAVTGATMRWLSRLKVTRKQR